QREFTMSGTFPKTVTDLDGHKIDVEDLLKHYVLIFITLKSTLCPVCPQLLLLLNLHGLQDNPPAEFRDPFDYSVTRVPPEEISTDAYFLVLCPGPVEDVRRIKESCNFPYPFIADEDLSIASSMNLINWRGPKFYGHDDLLKYLLAYRVRSEKDAVKYIDEAMELDTRLKNPLATELLDVNNSHQQLQAERQVILQKQLLPVELLSQIFEYFEPLEIVKSSMATCRQWRSIGLEVMVMRMRQQAKDVSNSMVICSEPASNDSIKLGTDNEGIEHFNQRVEELAKVIKIVQRLVV
ncbi:1554_t:CDS:2, partial [Acaulospora colombiana]